VAYAIVNRFRGGDKDQYEAAVAKVHPPDGLPEGQTIHAAGQADGEWVVVAIWDSKDSWERFRDETLMPGLQETEGAFEAPPEMTGFEVHNLQFGK
jgi:heme-degrading monooxygenase HmoA